MMWETPKNEGVGSGPLKAAGSRWATALTDDVYNVAHHAREAQTLEGVTRELFDPERGLRRTWSESMYSVMPVEDVVYKPPPGSVAPPAFVGRMPFVTEMLLSRAVTGKQVLFSRSDYNIPSYGNVNAQAHFRTSQFTHMGLIVAGDDPSIVGFYEQTLGLLRSMDRSGPPDGIGTQVLFDSYPGALQNLAEANLKAWLKLDGCKHFLFRVLTAFNWFLHSFLSLKYL